MNDYLLEIRTEEIPARFMSNILNDFFNKTKEILKENNLSYASLYTTGTARRIVLIIEKLNKNTVENKNEIKGPRFSCCYNELGNPTKELLSFMKKQNIVENQLIFKNINNIKYIFCKKFQKNDSLEILIQKIIKQILNNICFPKMMRWGSGNNCFIRPVRSIISLYNDKLLPITFCGIISNNWTLGHRFLGNTKIIINFNKDYIQKLKKFFVIVDHIERKKIIIKNLNIKEKILKGKISEDSRSIILNENLFLTEYPVLFIGYFDKKYLKLPKEVIKIIIEKYQKCFSIEKHNKKLINKFIGIRCGNKSGLKKIINGNEKVLKSRLEDAQFFYNEDRKYKLSYFKEKVNKIIFQEQLGTIGEKINRMKILSKYLGNKLFPKYLKDIEKTAILAKCDLETKMVYEFPELQGIVGSEYSKLDGENLLVSKGILEHYKPNFSSDSVSKIPTAVVVGIADKIDTIIGIISIGKFSTGSQDPYCLRRLGLGLIKTIIKNKLFISLKELIDKNYFLFKINLPNFDYNVIINFLKLRFKVILEEFLPKYIAEALLKNSFDDFYDFYLKAKGLNEFIKNKQIENFVEVFKRTNNILKYQKYDFTNKTILNNFNLKYLKEKEEIHLAKVIFSLKNEFEISINNKNYKKSLMLLGRLKNPLNNFFKKIIVMDKKNLIKINRLSLLNIIRKMFNKIFDIEFLNIKN